ncbi:MAG TPA: hypothetical protein VJT09_18395, partial [Pyrinomonadaceae bacterium]|nr:hypothetical protein [Pyrinomonadaceae bacterium]
IDLPEKVSMLTVAMKIPGDALTYETAASNFNATVDVLGGVYDEKGQPVSSFKDAVKVNAASTDPAKLKSNRVIYTAQVPVKPGLYQVRVAVRDVQSKRMGSATEWIEVPDLSKGNLTLGGLFISELKAEAAADADVFKLSHLSVDRRFDKTSKLLFLTYIYNAARGAAAGTAPDVIVQLRVFSELKPVLTTVFRRVSTEGITDLTRIPYSAEVPLAHMPPGRYTLQVTANDRIGKTSTSQVVHFAVE